MHTQRFPHRWTLRALALLSMVLISCASWALPSGHLTFRDPIGRIGPTDSIDLTVTLTLDNNSSPLVFDEAGAIDPGVMPHDLSNLGIATLFEVHLMLFFECSPNFGLSCFDNQAYEFPWTELTHLPELQGRTIRGGESFDIAIGTLVPLDGKPVPVGNYDIMGASLWLMGLGLTDDNQWVNQSLSDTWIAKTCDGAEEGCSLHRTVVAQVPAPATGVLAIGALLMLWGYRALRAARGPLTSH